MEETLARARDRHRAGALAEAREIYDRILAAEPDNGDALHLRGILALQEDNPAMAEELIRRAVGGAPDNPDYLSGLGQVLFARGDFAGAAQAFEHAVAERPGDARLAFSLGTAELHRSDWRTAERWLRAAIELGEETWEGHANLALALMRTRRAEEADEQYARALDLAPDAPAVRAPILTSRGDALLRAGRPEEAERVLEDALALAPGFAPAHGNLSNVRMALADPAGALAALDAALAIDPAFDEAAHKRLFFLNYDADKSAAEIAAAHRDWGVAFAARHGSGEAPAARGPAPEVLHVGYVSRDLGEHSVGQFMRALLPAHDRGAVRVTCYSGLEFPDDASAEMRAASDGWRDTAGMGDDALAAAIRGDGIDVLVDLSGHTGGNRLAVFARRPAPVQITYLGYPGSVGLPAIGFRIADAWTDPEGAAEALSTERILRLPGGCHCFAAPRNANGQAPDPGPPPSAAAGHVTFGSFNNLAKVNARVIALWAQILAAVPGARLLLKDQRFRTDAVRARFVDAFAAQGIGAERLDLRPSTPARADHLAAYGEVDICLDPFPYNGTTTTCEALWMGVPMVTLEGDRHAGRVGLSLLSQIEAPELIAADAVAYGEIAAGLAADAARLARYRRELRERLRASSLGDPDALARKLEAAYREAWETAAI